MINTYSIFAFKEKGQLGKIFQPVLAKYNINEEIVNYYFKSRKNDRGGLSVIVFCKNEALPKLYLKINKDPRDYNNIKSEFHLTLKAHDLIGDNNFKRINKTNLINLDRNRVAIVQEYDNGENLANYFLSQNYSKQIIFAKQWIQTLNEWIINFHSKTVNHNMITKTKMNDIISSRLDMAKEIDSVMNTNIYHRIGKIIKDNYSDKTRLPIGFIHGDYSPINIIFKNLNDFSVIDWEDANEMDCTIDDFCNLIFSFGVRIKENTLYNKSNILFILYKIGNRIINKPIESNKSIDDYTFYEDEKLMLLFQNAWEYYASKLNIDKAIINWWIYLYVVKYAYMELSIKRNDLNKCNSWIDLFDKMISSNFILHRQ